MIDLYNPIKFTCKLLHKQLDIPTDKMGASDYCLLDRSPTSDGRMSAEGSICLCVSVKAFLLAKRGGNAFFCNMPSR